MRNKYPCALFQVASSDERTNLGGKRHSLAPRLSSHRLPVAYTLHCIAENNPGGGNLNTDAGSKGVEQQIRNDSTSLAREGHKATFTSRCILNSTVTPVTADGSKGSYLKALQTLLVCFHMLPTVRGPRGGLRCFCCQFLQQRLHRLLIESFTYLAETLAFQTL